MTWRVPGSTIGERIGAARSRVTCQDSTGYRETSPMPYDASAPWSSWSVAARQSDPGVPTSAGTNFQCGVSIVAAT